MIKCMSCHSPRDHTEKHIYKINQQAITEQIETKNRIVSMDINCI